VLTCHVQDVPARHERGHAGASGQQLRNVTGRSRQMLEVVEHQQDTLIA
jgi:hypothetical protein